MLNKLIDANSSSITPVGKIVNDLASMSAGKDLSSPEYTQYALGVDLLGEQDYERVGSQLSVVVDELDSVISQITTGLESDGYTPFNKSQIKAAKIGALISGDPRAYLSNVSAVPKSGAGQLVSTVGNESEISHTFSFEAYDERENAKVAEYTTVFNLLASRQDEFAEALFPSIIVSPDDAGMSITINAVQLYVDIARSIDGSLDAPKFNLKKIMDAYRDSSVLDHGSLRLVPEYDSTVTTHADLFWDGANNTSGVTIDGTTVNTAPLAVGKRMSLLGVSQNDALISAGIMDQTDSLDPFLRLEEVYINSNISVGTPLVPLNEAGYFKVTTSHLVGSNFVQSLQEHHRDMVLTFIAPTIVIEESNFNNLTGAAINTDGVFLPGHKVVMHLAMAGTTNLETSDTVVYGQEWSVKEVYDAAGAVVAAGPARDAMVDMFNAMTISGYTLEAYRTNSNRRSRGQMVRADRMTYIYTVTPVGPLSVIKPFNDARDDATDLSTLISIVKIKASNDAVTTLLKYSGELATNITASEALGLDPNLHTPSTYLVNSYYRQETVDLLTVVDSVSSGQREVDIREALLNKIKDQVYQMAANTSYLQALEVYYGSNVAMPTVIVATDGQIASYLNTGDGQKQTIGGAFNMVVVDTVDARMSGKMFITFGIFDGTRNVTPNPLNFGCTAWIPEVTVVVPITRNNSVSKELTVDPRYRHIPLLPMLVEFNVTNIPGVLNKVTINNSI